MCQIKSEQFQEKRESVFCPELRILQNLELDFNFVKIGKTLIVWVSIYFFTGFSGANAAGKNDFSLRSAEKAGIRSADRATLSSSVRFAQLGDDSVRLGQLEEQTRWLNGRVEELNFQLLQIQERVRKMEEDNEFRFQELEEKKHGKTKSSEDFLPEKQKVRSFGSETGSKKRRLAQGRRVGKVLTEDNQRLKMIEKSGSVTAGKTDGREVSRNPDNENKIPSGTIIFDDHGKIKHIAMGKPLDLTTRLGRADSNHGKMDTIEAGEKFSLINSARELYDLGYNYFQGGDYSFSQQAFSEFSERFPENKKIPDAKFWLGESLFSQSSFKEAAKVFLDVYTNWPDSGVAPQALLKLGVSLAGMEQRELACSTYARVFRKYPNASHSLRRRVEAERKSANCLNG